jgi:MFS family permease
MDEFSPIISTPAPAGLLGVAPGDALDQTVVTTALPTIVADLGSLSQLAWVVTAYLLSVMLSTPLWRAHW